MTKIDIFSGFLGAGKTTLIKKLIAEAFEGEKVVLIENEFGEINIDSGFLKDAGVEITEMSSGCICCTLVGDFGQALRNVVSQFSPDRILIEPSGVGKLSDVIRAVCNVEQDMPIVLNSFVTVADAKKVKMYAKNFGEFYLDQIEHAKTIILSRTGDIKEDRLKACVDILRGHNEKARIVTTPWDQLTGAQILEAMESDKSFADELLEELAKEPLHEHHHHHDHDHDHDHEHEHHHDDHEHHHHEDGTCSCGHDHHDHEHHHDDHEHHHHEDGTCSCGHDHHDHEHHHDDHEHHHHEDGTCSCGHDHHDHEHHHHDHEHHHHEDGTCSCGHDHHDHDADEVFTSWGAETIRKYTAEELKEAMEELDLGVMGTVLRAKGIVPSDDGKWLHFDYVPGESEVREGPAGYAGQICVIGAKLEKDKLSDLFRI